MARNEIRLIVKLRFAAAPATPTSPVRIGAMIPTA
jgi:hypothetical protein